MTKKLLLIFLLTSCNCDEYYNKDQKIIDRLEDFKGIQKLISENYTFLKSTDFGFTGNSPEHEGVIITLDKVKALIKNKNNEKLESIKAIWDKEILNKNGAVKFYIDNGLPSLHIDVKKCGKIVHIIYYDPHDIYDYGGQSDDYSSLALVDLGDHWWYVIRQINY